MFLYFVILIQFLNKKTFLSLALKKLNLFWAIFQSFWLKPSKQFYLTQNLFKKVKFITTKTLTRIFQSKNILSSYLTFRFNLQSVINKPLKAFWGLRKILVTLIKIGY